MEDQKVEFQNRAEEMVFLYEHFEVNDYPSPSFNLADILLLLENGREGTKVKRIGWPDIETLTYTKPLSGTAGLAPSKELGIKINSKIVFEPYIMKRYSYRDFAVWVPQPFELFARDYVFVKRHNPNAIISS